MRIPAPVRLATLAGALCFAALTSAVAQRPDSLPAPARDPARADTASQPLPGPRVPAKFQRAEQRLVPSLSENGSAQEGRMHTIRLSTLALILIGVIVLILILR